MKLLWIKIKSFFGKKSKDKKYGWVKPIQPKPSYEGETQLKPFEGDILSDIGYAFFNKHYHPTEEEKNNSNLFEEATVKAVNETGKTIDMMDITDISVVQTFDESIYIITITLGRPGIFIGVKGSDIGMVENYLSDKYKKKVVFRLKEDKIMCRIHDYEYILYGFYGDDY